MTPIDRRGLLAGGGGLALLLAGTPPAPASTPVTDPTGALNVRDFGAAGDGIQDDSGAIEQAFKAALAGADAQFILLPAGRYRVTRPIRVVTQERPAGNLTRRAGILARGAQIISAISDGGPVIEIDCRATVRFFQIEGLEIKGSGRDGHGLFIRCEKRGTYFYNFCLRDMVIEGCGGDGCRMIGNIFEGQVFNAYFRDNRRDGATFGHGPENTVFSAVHLFGCVFGGNGRNGVSLIDGATDISFHGCYFLLNQKFGLSADTGVTLLSHCGFENNHMAATEFDAGDAGLRLKVGGTLVGCTAYSIYQQTHLVRAYVTNSLTLIGCSGMGGARAKGAGLAVLEGRRGCDLNLIGCTGGIDRDKRLDVTIIGRGAQFGGRWNSQNLTWLGDYCLWVDDQGRLRIKRGQPEWDSDGKVISVEDGR